MSLDPNRTLAWLEANPKIKAMLQAELDKQDEADRPKPVVRVYAKKPGEPVHAYDIAATRDEAIKAVRAEGYPRAMTLVPKEFLQLEFKA